MITDLGCLENVLDRLRDLRPDPVTLDQCDFVVSLRVSAAKRLVNAWKWL